MVVVLVKQGPRTSRDIELANTQKSKSGNSDGWGPGCLQEGGGDDGSVDGDVVHQRALVGGPHGLQVPRRPLLQVVLLVLQPLPHGCRPGCCSCSFATGSERQSA